MIWKSQHGKWVPAALHHAAQGLTAIIVGAGPSLSQIDTMRLAGAGRVVIGMNSSYPQVRPDYWLGMDTPENYPPSLWQESFPKLLRSGSHNARALNTHRDFPGVHFMDVREVPQGWQEAVFQTRGGAVPVWFKDTFRTAIQFALHLGCTRLVFAGVDLDTSAADYAHAERCLTDAQRSYNAALYAQQAEWLAWFVPAAAQHGIACASLSPASLINRIMPQVSLEELNVPTKLASGAPHCTAPWLVECNEAAALRQRGGKPYSEGHRAMYLTAVELLRRTRASVNEFGFGIGYGLGELVKAECVGDYWGCEPCAEAFEHTWTQFGATPGVTLVRGGWRDAVAPMADYAFAVEVLEHLPPEDRAPFLQHMLKTTRHALFLSTPDSRTSLHGVLTAPELLALLAEAGWRAVAVPAQWTTFYLATPTP